MQDSETERLIAEIFGSDSESEAEDDGVDSADETEDSVPEQPR